MAEDVKGTLGQYLKREREARHISLEDMPKATKISSPFIRALEDDDFDFFSQQEAIPGYLKLYTRHLGLDYDDALRWYHIQSELYNSSKSFQQLPLFLDYDSPPIMPAKVNKRSLNRHIVGITVSVTAAVVLISLLMYLYLPTRPSQDIDMKDTSPSPNLVQQAPTMGETAPDPVQPEKADIVPLPSQSEIPGQPQQSSEVIDPDQANRVKAENAHPEAPALSARKLDKKVIGNSDSKRYHLPGMKYYNMIQAYHRVEFNSEEEAVKAGYHKARE
jgi:cytoskeleton protein RodZ